MATGLDGRSYPAKSLGLALCEVEQAVMGWVETPGNRQTQLDAHGNPVPKEHTLLGEMITDDDVPLRQVVNKEGSTWFEYPLAVAKP
jgi:hypothetical protein